MMNLTSTPAERRNAAKLLAGEAILRSECSPEFDLEFWRAALYGALRSRGLTIGAAEDWAGELLDLVAEEFRTLRSAGADQVGHA